MYNFVRVGSGLGRKEGKQRLRRRPSFLYEVGHRDEPKEASCSTGKSCCRTQKKSSLRRTPAHMAAAVAATTATNQSFTSIRRPDALVRGENTSGLMVKVSVWLPQLAQRTTHS